MNFRNTTALSLIAAIMITAISFQACDKEEEPAFLAFRLTDAPGNFDQVNIDIQAIEIKIADSTINWTVFNPGVYNLLDLTNGLDTLLVSGNVPEGKLSQIRLILGTNNTVMVDSVLYPLSTPSAQQSGLKLNVHYDIVAGLSYEFTLDFDANKSIVLTGNNNYKLKPVIRVFTTAASGAIEGVVFPAQSAYSAEAVVGVDTFSTVPDTVSGYFLIPGIPAGVYDVSLFGNTGYQDSTISGVSVITGTITDLDTIFM